VHDGPRPMYCEGPLKVAFQRSPFDRPLMAALEVVERDGDVAGTRQCLAGVAADKAGSAGDEDGLHGCYAAPRRPTPT
jgi:hypothetical protein